MAFCQKLHLNVIGENTATTTILNKINTTSYFTDFNSLKKQLDSIQLTLNKKGFINSSIKSLKKENDSTYIAQINTNTKIETVIIKYNNSIIATPLIKFVTKDATYNKFAVKFENLENTLNIINDKLAKNGLPFSKLRLDNLKLISKHTLQAELISNNTKEKRYLNHIIVKGYEKFPKSFLKHYLKLKKTQVFNLSKIKAKTNALKSLNFAKEIKPPEVLFTKDSTTLYIYVEKKRSNAFDGFLGFNTEEKTNTLKLNGYVNLELTNNLNYGESLKIAYKNDDTEQRSFDTNINLPYLFNTPFGIELQLNLFKKDSSFTTTQQKAKLFYQIAQKHKLATNYNTSESNNLLKSDTPSIKDYNNQFYSATYTFTNNSKINSFNELNAFLRLEYGTGHRQSNNLKTNQQLLLFKAHKIFNLNFNNSLFLKISASALESENFIENELFRFGGINSIRGFNENSLFANQFSVINTEYRYKLSPSIYIHSITDIGHLKNDATSQKFNLYSLGIGLAMKTKGGILRFNYANGRSKNQPFKFSNSKIHLSLTSVF